MALRPYLQECPEWSGSAGSQRNLSTMWPNDPQQPPTGGYPQVPPQPPTAGYPQVPPQPPTAGYPQGPQSPYGLPPLGPPRRNSTGPVTASLIAMGLVLVMTIVSFAVAHSDTKTSGSGQLPGAPTGQPTLGQNGPQGRSSGDQNGGTTSSVPTTPTYTPSTEQTTPSTEPTTPQGPTLNTTRINNTIDEFFWGLLYHDVTRVKAVSCPARRHDFDKGTYIYGKEVYKWHYTYRVTPGLSYVDVPVKVTLRNPSSGAIGGSWNYTWVVELVGSTYYMCGVRD